MSTPAVSLPRAADLDLDDIPYVEGMAISCMPPAAEYFDDPFWYDSGGRNPLVQREILKLEAGEERTRRLRGIVQDFRFYGPLLYEVAAEAGRADIIRLLHQLGANPNVRSWKEDSDAEDAAVSTHDNAASAISGAEENALRSGTHECNEPNGVSPEGSNEENDEAHTESVSGSQESEHSPMIAIHPPLTGAAFAGQLECVQILLDEVKVSIDECDDNGSALAYAVSGGHSEVAELLLSRGASIHTNPDHPDIMSLAMKGGRIAVVKALLASEQWKASGLKVTIEHLPFASFSKSGEAVNLVLSICGLPSPTGNIKNLTSSQSEAILDAITRAIEKCALDCLYPLLSHVTHQRSDGSYDYFEGPEHFEIKIFNATEDAMAIADNPDLFKLAWDTIIHRPGSGLDEIMARTPSDANGSPNITVDEALHRRLISAAGRGRMETTKLIHEHYDADVNHVSHKYSTTSLSRAAGQGLYDLEGRLSVVRYLLEHTNADPSVAQGEYANGPTPLALSIKEGQPGMVKLLLELGGPVDSIGDDVRSHVEQQEREEQVPICVVYFPKDIRHEVRVMTKEAAEKASEEEITRRITLKWERDALLSILARLRMRGSDEDLRKADPKGRPLAQATIQI